MHTVVVSLSSLCQLVEGAVSGTVPGPGGAEREKMVLRWAPQAGRGAHERMAASSPLCLGGARWPLQWGRGGPMPQVRSPASSRPAQPLPFPTPALTVPPPCQAEGLGTGFPQTRPPLFMLRELRPLWVVVMGLSDQLLRVCHLTGGGRSLLGLVPAGPKQTTRSVNT